MEDIIFYVIYCGEDRLNFMKKQIKELSLPFTIVYFKAYTPEESQNWMDKNDISPDKLQCCLRSHIECIHHFYTNYHNKKYLCILEDDVCLLKNNFKDEFLKGIDSLKEVQKEGVNYMSIGYLPTITTKSFKTPFLDNEKFDLVKNYNNLYYDFTNCSFTIWGTQAQVFPIETTKLISDLLFRENSIELKKSAEKYLEKNGYQQFKGIYLTPDSILPSMFSQSVLYKPLAIEAKIYSKIHDEDDSKNRFTNWENWEKNGSIELKNYWSYE